MKIRPHFFSFIAIALFPLMVGFVSSVQAATFTVTKTADTNGANCTDPDADCSLREAINAVNAGSGGDTIAFNVSGAGCVLGVCTIQPTSALPNITQSVTIDGYTQPGSSPNSNGPGLADNSMHLIVINGSSAGGGANGLTIASSNNLISGLVINSFSGSNGISFLSGSNTIVSGNFIGTNAAGTSAVPNGMGVRLNGVGTTVNTIGGTAPANRNLISGNNVIGVAINAQSADNLVLGNFIGTDITGTLDLGNNVGGVDISGGAEGNTVGGLSAAARNIISGNASFGVYLLDPSANPNFVQGNFIGTDLTGTQALGNTNLGVGLEFTSGQIVGGTSPGAGNLISGNIGDGVGLTDGADGNFIQGNSIGLSSSGLPLGNGGNGIRISDNNCPNNTLGGALPGAGNVIAFNSMNGIFIQFEATSNAILGNSIFSNMELGIDLGPAGVTGNDAGDSDAGANNLQNFPDLSSAVSANGSTVIQGSLNSTASDAFRIEFFANDACDPSGNGEGQTFLGFEDVTTDGVGNTNIDATLPVALTGTQFITATATNSSSNDSSEFSPCILATILVEDCTNGTDDDSDTLVDCQDPDCALDPACIPNAEICNNGTDDDGDGAIDCNDTDCSSSFLCSGITQLSGSGCSLAKGPAIGANFLPWISLLLILVGMVLWRNRLA